MKSKEHVISNLLHFLLMATSVFLAFSCSKDDDGTNDPVPIPIGNAFAFVDLNHQWIYDVTVSQQGVSRNAVDTFVITEKMNDTVFKVEENLDWIAKSGTISYWMKNENQFAECSTPGGDYPLIYLKSDSKAGDMFYYIIAGDTTITHRIVSLDKTVSTPLNTFKCAEIEQLMPGDANYKRTIYINKTYGLVRFDLTWKPYGTTMTQVTQLKKVNF